jgi:hypothetical protein
VIAAILAVARVILSLIVLILDVIAAILAVARVILAEFVSISESILLTLDVIAAILAVARVISVSSVLISSFSLLILAVRAAILAVARVISASLESNRVAIDELTNETEDIDIPASFKFNPYTEPNEPVDVFEPLTEPRVSIVNIEDDTANEPVIRGVCNLILSLYLI